ncbi:pentatricopeptide repeat-containing protein At4g39620, chloroplastic [Lathyrus oleraceus]|uniref:Pentatricopeptide repeat-containing protein n=1 Tax=Pisum sativum TaxID=3888 RepID=A0A9D4VKG0_PEA|nr:pentatricopeptide repeat-containing protein At4g39620, chloroplastic [Pisum sativum]KAI5384376.1 hypothetical protein KIW84_071403 [Pisum sativum]
MLSHSHSLQQPFPIAMSAVSFSTPSSYYHSCPSSNPPRVTLLTRISCVSNPTRPIRKRTTDQSETLEFVRLLTRKITDKEPLLKTLNKYVKVVRTEHCFLLFEELGKHDKWLQCLEVFRWMQRQRWYIADNGVYSKLISIMGKKGQIRLAMWLFSEMRNTGCRPDTSVYNSLISAHLHSRDKSKALDKALGYFEKMKGTERCKPNIVTYNILLRAFAQARNVDQVNSLFKDLDESVLSSDIYTFNGVMDGYGKNGMIRDMESVLAQMKSNQVKPDLITYNLLIDAYGKKQQFDKMEQVFKSLLHSKVKPALPTFNSMILNYGKARQKDKAEDVFQNMTDMGYTPSFVTHESLIYMYGLCGCVSKAVELFDRLIRSNVPIKVSTLNYMLDVYCINGLPQEADSLFARARSLKIIPDASTYKLLYKAYTKANTKELLDKLLKQMDKDGIIPNKRFFVDALGAIGSSRVKSGSANAGTDSNSTQKIVKTQLQT